MTDNHHIGRMLRELSAYLEMEGVGFKPRAYEKAAEAVEACEAPIARLFEEGGTEAVATTWGGKSIAQKIVELLETEDERVRPLSRRGADRRPHRGEALPGPRTSLHLPSDSKPDGPSVFVGRMRNPNVDILFHPTGRILQKRDPYHLDFDEVCGLPRRREPSWRSTRFPIGSTLTTSTFARRSEPA